MHAPLTPPSDSLNTYMGLSRYDCQTHANTPPRGERNPHQSPLRRVPGGLWRIPGGGWGTRHKRGDHGQCQGWLTAAGRGSAAAVRGQSLSLAGAKGGTPPHELLPFCLPKTPRIPWWNNTLTNRGWVVVGYPVALLLHSIFGKWQHLFKSAWLHISF